MEVSALQKINTDEALTDFSEHHLDSTRTGL